MTSNFKIVISSDIDYDDLCAEIYYNDQFVAIISQEKGFDNLEISIYPPKNKHQWDFKYAEFEDILKHAKKTLWEMQKG